MAELRRMIPTVRRFLGELRRRKVWRVAVIYGVVAGGVIGLAAEVVRAVGLEEAWITVAVVLAALGLPLALALGWSYDMTWGGIERTESISVSEKQAEASQTAGSSSPSGDAGAPARIEDVAAPQEKVSPSSLPAPDLSAEPSPDVSAETFRRFIVVQPFENLSPDDFHAVGEERGSPQL
jgi:hypothetical protein